MKYAIFAIVFLLILSQIALAEKTVAYVSKTASVKTGCVDLTGEDKVFCERLTALGYKVVPNSEFDVIINNQKWQTNANQADIIFLGDVTDASVKGDDFATGLSAYFNRKVIFSTHLNNYLNISDPKNFKIGYGAGKAITPQYFYSDNVCKLSSYNNFVRQKNDFVTKGISDSFEVYTSLQHDVKVGSPKNVNDKVTKYPGTVWVTNYCVADNLPQTSLDDNVVVAMKDNVVFWGLDLPSKYTDTTNRMFDRMILYLMGDSSYNYSIFTIPEFPTNNQPFWLFAKIYDRTTEKKDVIVNATLGNVPLDIYYNNNTRYWEVRGIQATPAVNVTFLTDRLDYNAIIKGGDLVVDIASPNYKAENRTFTIAAQVTADKIPQAARVSYRIRDKNNLTVLYSGDLNPSETFYRKDVDIGNLTEFLLEVNAQNRSILASGGNFKTFLLGGQIDYGKDYKITPKEYFITSRTGSVENIQFNISAVGKSLNNIKVTPAGDLASKIIVDTTGMKANLAKSETTGFSAALNYEDIAEGKYTGKVRVESDEFSYEVPIEVNYLPSLEGKWITVVPNIWKTAIPEGRPQTGNFTLKNLGSWPATKFSAAGTGDFVGKVTIKPLQWVKGGEEETMYITLDTTGLPQGIHTGDIIIGSSIGNATITVNVDIISDFLPQITSIEELLSQIEQNITDLGTAGADISSVSGKLNETRRLAEELKAKFEAGDYSGARASIASVKSKVESLQRDSLKIVAPEKNIVGGGFDFSILFYAVGGLIIIVVIYFVSKKFLSKKKGKQAEEAPPEEGQGYQDEGPSYQPQYY